jgi:hypothetical protein
MATVGAFRNGAGEIIVFAVTIERDLVNGGHQTIVTFDDHNKDLQCEIYGQLIAKPKDPIGQQNFIKELAERMLEESRTNPNVPPALANAYQLNPEFALTEATRQATVGEIRKACSWGEASGPGTNLTIRISGDSAGGRSSAQITDETGSVISQRDTLDNGRARITHYDVDGTQNRSKEIPEKFDVNSNPKFPYESTGARPDPGRNGPPSEFRNPSTPGDGYLPSPPDATGRLYSNPQSPPRQFGPVTLPAPGNSPTDILGPRNSNSGSSSIPAYSTQGQIGNGSGPGPALQPINGNAANPTGNDIGGAWTTAQQYMSGQPGRMRPAVTPTYNMPGMFPESGTSPIGYLNGASQTGTFDPAAPDVPPPRPRPPQAPASWPNSPVAPLQQMPQAEPAAPWHPDWHDAGDGSRQNLPNWAQLQPPTENSFPASNGVGGMADDQPPAPENAAPPPALTVQNLTTHVLRMKGVPDADIGAAISDPAKMQSLLNQVYDRRSMTAPGDGNGGFGNQFGQTTSAGQSGQASTPAAATSDNYLPFGWAGLPPLLR